METVILMPKGKKGKRPAKVRKPSKPLDGINHRLLREQQAKAVDVPADDAPPSRSELIEKAKQLGVSFNRRTKNDVLLLRITKALNGE